MAHELPPRRTMASLVMTAVGWLLTIAPLPLLAMSAFMKLSQHPQAVEGFKSAGYPDGTLFPIAIAEVVATVLYAIPQTAVLGVVILTGYLGGAISHHVRLGDGGFWIPGAMAVVLWLGLYLRDARLRALLPFRR